MGTNDNEPMTAAQMNEKIAEMRGILASFRDEKAEARDLVGEMRSFTARAENLIKAIAGNAFKGLMPELRKAQDEFIAKSVAEIKAVLKTWREKAAKEMGDFKESIDRFEAETSLRHVARLQAAGLQEAMHDVMVADVGVEGVAEMRREVVAEVRRQARKR